MGLNCNLSRNYDWNYSVTNLPLKHSAVVGNKKEEKSFFSSFRVYAVSLSLSLPSFFPIFSSSPVPPPSTAHRRSAHMTTMPTNHRRGREAPLLTTRATCTVRPASGHGVKTGRHLSGNDSSRANASSRRLCSKALCKWSKGVFETK